MEMALQFLLAATAAHNGWITRFSGSARCMTFLHTKP